MSAATGHAVALTGRAERIVALVAQAAEHGRELDAVGDVARILTDLMLLERKAAVEVCLKVICQAKTGHGRRAAEEIMNRISGRWDGTGEAAAEISNQEDTRDTTRFTEGGDGI